MNSSVHARSGIEDAREAAEFVDFFAAVWAIGASDPDRFFSTYASRVDPDALMFQPIVPMVRGAAPLRDHFGPLFAAVPDLRGKVLRWGATADGVLIELTLSGTLGGKPLALTVVDRFILEEGVVRERHSYFDSVPLLKAMATRPLAALPLLPALLRRRGR